MEQSIESVFWSLESLYRPSYDKSETYGGNSEEEETSLPSEDTGFLDDETTVEQPEDEELLKLPKGCDTMNPVLKQEMLEGLKENGDIELREEERNEITVNWHTRSYVLCALENIFFSRFLSRHGAEGEPDNRPTTNHYYCEKYRLRIDVFLLRNFEKHLDLAMGGEKFDARLRFGYRILIKKLLIRLAIGISFEQDKLKCYILNYEQVLTYNKRTIASIFEAWKRILLEHKWQNINKKSSFKEVNSLKEKKLRLTFSCGAVSGRASIVPYKRKRLPLHLKNRSRGLIESKRNTTESIKRKRYHG
eukprot:augustus_masked-scaffold_31-processed-gene-3.68-mRNA-1 protein AED:1.00 eAED:1.00 QI:0/-1/0/0/-1/1/1/0/304